MNGLESIPVKLSDEDKNDIVKSLFKLLVNDQARKKAENEKNDFITQAVLCRDYLDCSPTTFNKHYRVDFPFTMKGSIRMYRISDVGPWKDKHKQILDEHSI